ncbi:MAG: hypothetical protein BMS9Abin18_1327 [Zetaproteobacteria bacterium]|nr:MAG: hypothetical protein BMS9Abin18_1327 [Zetaproteobacteria bacterium]
MNLNTVVKRNPEIVHSDMDGETVMMSIVNSSYYGLNPVASHIWDLLESEMSVRHLCDLLQEKYDVSGDRCCEEVCIFLTRMAEDKIIEIT